jgi:hypothetical protein
VLFPTPPFWLMRAMTCIGVYRSAESTGNHVNMSAVGLAIRYAGLANVASGPAAGFAGPLRCREPLDRVFERLEGPFSRTSLTVARRPVIRISGKP